jgi:Arc/MetJ-type ribon-helix-helix transcriptional regulator
MNLGETLMATVRLDIKTETALKRLTVKRGKTRSEVVHEAITRLADEEEKPLSAYQRLQAFVGVVDSGGKQLSTETGKRLRELLEERSGARRPG